MSKDERHELFKKLNQEAMHLSLMWKFYKGLFGDKKNVDRMNQISSGGFHHVQTAMINDLIRRICAITDPAKTRSGNKNLTIKRILESAMPEYRAEPKTQQKLDELDDDLKMIRQHRNKRLMHFDENVVGPSGKDLPPLLYNHIKRAINNIFEILSTYSVAHWNTGKIYEWANDHSGSEIERLLADSLRFRKLRELAMDQSVPAETIRNLVLDRSGRDDPPEFRDRLQS